MTAIEMKWKKKDKNINLKNKVDQKASRKTKRLEGKNGVCFCRILENIQEFHWEINSNPTSQTQVNILINCQYSECQEKKYPPGSSTDQFNNSWGKNVVLYIKIQSNQVFRKCFLLQQDLLAYIQRATWYMCTYLEKFSHW